MADMFSFNPPGQGAPEASRPAPGAPEQGAPADGGGGAILRDVAEKHPDLLEEMLGTAAEAIDSGELTPQEVVTLGNLAATALRNPQAYRALAKFALQNGAVDMMPEPGTADAARVTAALTLVTFQLTQMLQQGGEGAAPGGMAGPVQGNEQPAPGGQPPQGGDMFAPPGGGPGGADGYQQDGRYVLPTDAVRRLGTDKLDKMSLPPEPPAEKQPGAQ